MGSVDVTADELVKLLELQPHPEGGYFVETFKDETVLLEKTALPNRFKVGRSASTAIYYLLPSGTFSHLHRLPSAEVWHFYAGDPLTVFEINAEGEAVHTVLGKGLRAGQKPQHIVSPNIWFGAYPTQDWHPDGSKAAPRDPQKHYSLVGCTVSPGFEFADFEMAKKDKLLARYPNLKTWIDILNTRPEG